MENMREDLVHFDLNEEPMDPPHGSMVGLGTLLNEIETVHGRIEERIRQLEAVTLRARQRQRWRQARAPEAPSVSVTPSHNLQNEYGLATGECSVAAPERMVESSKVCNRDGSHIIAKALAVDPNHKSGGESCSFFDCNICLDVARDPILTCCGHLFCWPCFYQLSYVRPNSKECPVCRGEVTDSNITPIYGNGNNALKSREEGLDFGIPPRPQAHRVESARQHRVYRPTYAYPIEEAMLLFGTRVGAIREVTHELDLESVHITAERTNFMDSSGNTSQALRSPAESSRRLPSARFSRLLSQGASSLTSLSSALNSAERLVEDLEAFIHSHQRRRTPAQSASVGDRDSMSSIAAGIQSGSQTMDTTAEIDWTLPHSSSSSWRRSDNAAINLNNQLTDTAINVDLTVPRSSSSSRRRSDFSRSSDADSGVSREPRRRRLR